MNLYELAHHPDAWDQESNRDNIWFGNAATQEQFLMLNSYTPEPYEAPVNCPSCEHTEMTYRMHLLFVHWATLPPKE